MVLKAPSIQRVILSNNNPNLKMADWFGNTSSRVTVIEQGSSCASSLRYRIALEQDSPLFVAIDDDVFLRPSQIETLCETLRAHPCSPCGICGSVYDERSHVLHNIGRPGDVDIIHQAYAFTPRHVRRFFDLATALRLGPAHEAWQSTTWDDIVISHSGLSKPRVADVGAFTECPTGAEAGVAAWRADGFVPFRMALFHRLRALQPPSPAEAADISR